MTNALTLENIGHLEEIFDAILLSEENDIPVDGLETLEEYRERFRLHYSKSFQPCDYKATIEKSMQKAGNDDRGRRHKLISVMKEMMHILHKEGPEMDGHRRDSALVKGLLKTEGTSVNLVDDCKVNISRIENEECLIIVAGETSAGKSSVLNLLFEEDILPVHNNSSTSVITIVRYHKRKHVRIVYKDDTLDTVFDLDELGIEQLHSIAFMKSASERENHTIKEVHVYLPLFILRSGLVLVDTPGIGENEFLETELINFISDRQILGFMYIIKTDNAGGVQEDRLMNLLKIILNKQKLKSRDSNSGMKFDPKSAVFVCNRFDLIDKFEVETVKRNAFEKLSQCWPSFDKSQVIFLSTEKARRDVLVDRDYINDNYRVFLESLRDIFMSALERRIKHTYKWIEHVLKRTVHHLKSMVKRLDYSDRDLKEKSDQARTKLESLSQRSDDLIRGLTSDIGTKSKELCVTLRDYVKTPFCKMKLSCLWKEDEIPKVDSGLGDWPWIKSKLHETFYDKLTTCIEEWDNDENTIDDIETEISSRIQFDLKLLESELEAIENEMQGDASSEISDGFSELSKNRRRASSIAISPTKLASLFYVTDAKMPVKLAGRFIKPFKSIVSGIMNSIKVNDYRKDPVAVAEEYAKEMYVELLKRTNGEDSGLTPFVDYLMDRPREYIAALERKIPDMILANKLLLNEFEECIETERCHHFEYEELMTQTESLRRSLMEYGEGYIFVDDFAKGEIQITQFSPEHGSVSVAFNVVDFLRSSSSHVLSRRMDIRGLWTVTYSGQLVRNGVARPVAIRMYLPSSGVQHTFREVAKLRCLQCQDMCISEFLGIHSAESITPAFVYGGSLKSARRFLNSFCCKRECIPSILEEVACGLEYLHSKGLVHMELTQDTVTVDEDGNVQLTGACLPRVAKLPIDCESLETGNFAYLAPEVLRGEKYDTFADIYSFGLLVLELTQVDVPVVFMDQRKMTLCDFIRTVDADKMLHLDELVEVFKIRTRALICNCLEIVKDMRPEMAEVTEYASYIKHETDALDKLPLRRTKAMIKRPSIGISTKL